jgi:hypothetical protein
MMAAPSDLAILAQLNECRFLIPAPNINGLEPVGTNCMSSSNNGEMPQEDAGENGL